MIAIVTCYVWILTEGCLESKKKAWDILPQALSFRGIRCDLELHFQVLHSMSGNEVFHIGSAEVFLTP